MYSKCGTSCVDRLVPVACCQSIPPPSLTTLSDVDAFYIVAQYCYVFPNSVGNEGRGG